MTNTNTAEETNNSSSASTPTTAAARLEAGVQALTVPEPLAEAETLLLKSGAVLPVIGLVLMIAAWWSASDTPYVADQIPMLISGGLVGLGLLLVGLGLFLRYSLTRLFRFWLARVIVEQQTQNERVLAALDGIETAIRESRLNR
jgi:hypothetical protein